MPVVPFGRDVVVITGATVATVIIIDNVFVPSPALLVALTVKLDVPAVVGVPDIVPVDELIVKPAGKLPLDIDHVIGVVPVAARV